MSETIKHKEKSAYLLDKGLDLLWSNGYNGTSVNDIVKLADIPKGSFYFYFDSKEDFAVKALERYFGLKRSITKEILEDKSISPRQRLYNYYDQRVRIIRDELNCRLGCMGCNISTEMADHSEKIRTTIIREEAKTRQCIISVVEEAQEKKEIESTIDAGKLVAFMEDAYKGTLTAMKENKCPEPLDNYLYFLQNIILK